MGSVTMPHDVCLIVAICYHQASFKEAAMEHLVHNYGAVQYELAPVLFEHTGYYDREMGSPLYKMYLAFETLQNPALLPQVKHFTNHIEQDSAINGNRTVNIDPGYIETPKLILASTKNYSHRIYLSDGIYGDVQLFWQNGRFNANPWTYPDYKEDRVRLFFEMVRKNYFRTIRDQTSGNKL